MRGAIVHFANKMEMKLRQYDDDKGTNGWNKDTCSIAYLFDRMTQELREARVALDDCDPVELGKECIDIANFAMMISDRLLRSEE
jgi:hypothetical protein